jgi:hypothetical protein
MEATDCSNRCTDELIEDGGVDAVDSSGPESRCFISASETRRARSAPRSETKRATSRRRLPMRSERSR